MTTDTAADSTTPLTTDDLSETYEAEPIVIAVPDILDGVVGSLTGVEVGQVDGETLAWTGVDAVGSVRSGTMRMTVEVVGANAIRLAWGVDVDEA